MSKRDFLVASILLFAIGGVGTTARAQGPAPEADESSRVEIARIRDEAIGHDEAGRYGLAADRYLELYEALRQAHVARAPVALWNAGLAMTHIAGRERDARDTIQRFLDESTMLGDDPQVAGWRSEAVTRIADLDARMGSADSSRGGPGPDGQTVVSISPLGPIVIGFGVLALGMGAVFGALALNADNALMDECGGTACLDTPEHRAMYDEMKLFGVVTDVLLVSGGLVTIAGIVLTVLVTDSRPRDESAPSASVGLGFGRLSIFGRF